MKLTTCPLDCFDGCSVVVDENRNLKGNKEHPITKGYLCHHLNNYSKFPRIKKARYKNRDISLQESLEILYEKLSETEPSKILYYKGSGNLGVMQSVTKMVFQRYGSAVSKRGLCEEAGTYGIEEGRGASLVLSPEIVKESEVVIVWGRNISITNSHMLPALKGKKLIVIDPREIQIAKRADVFVQIKPRGDLYLAMLLARVAYMEQMEDVDFIENRCENFDYFIDEITGTPMVTLMQKSGVDLDKIGDILSIVEGKRVCFLVGIGVQKYTHGHSVLRAIDSFAAMLGLFGKKGCGVGYIDDSSFGFLKPFKVEGKFKQEPMAIAKFGDYNLSFIQGANPLSQMPSTQRVKEEFEKCKFVVYFGLYENETSKMADLVIPAKTFLEKEDLKLSYGHEYIGYMPKLFDSNIGVSEYELANFLNRKFGFEQLKSEKEYIDEIVASNSLKKGNFLISKSYEKLPYEDKFYTESGKFEFFDEYYDDFDDECGEFYLLAVKHNKSLNSQFQRDSALRVPFSLGLKTGDRVKLKRDDLECEYNVVVDKSLRDDCLALYSGGEFSNFLTPALISEEGGGAVFQELKVNLEKI